MDLTLKLAFLPLNVSPWDLGHPIGGIDMLRQNDQLALPRPEPPSPLIVSGLGLRLARGGNASPLAICRTLRRHCDSQSCKEVCGFYEQRAHSWRISGDPC